MHKEMGKMVDIVYQRRKKPQKTRNIQELIDIPWQQEQQPRQSPGDDESKTGTKSRSKSSPRRLSPEECNYEMLLSILRRKDSQGFFAKPVDGDEVEFYYETIEEPMDFGMIGTKIDKGKYRSIKQFESDVMLVFENAMLFNAVDTVYYRKAHVIKEVAKNLFHTLKSDPNNFQEKFFGSKQGESRKHTKANMRLLNSKAKEEETTKRKRQEAGPTKSKALTAQKRYTYYTSKKSSSVMKNDRVRALPNFNHSKSLVQRHSDYKRSLVNFTKGLGEVAQRAVMNRLREIQQEDDRVRNPVNQPQQYPVAGTAVAPVATTTSPNLFVNIPCMRNVEDRSGLLLQSSSGMATPTTRATYPKTMSSLNWSLNPPVGIQEGFMNSSFGQSDIWCEDGRHLQSGLNLSRQHSHSGDQVGILPSSNYSIFDTLMGGSQGSLSNSNYFGQDFHGRRSLNFRNSLVLRPKLHWGNQTNLPSSIVSNVNPQDSNFLYQNLSTHKGIGNRTSFQTENSARMHVHNHQGGPLNPLDPYCLWHVIRGEDQGDSPRSNLSRLINQVGNQMNTSSPNIELFYGVINKESEGRYIPEGFPRHPSGEAPWSFSSMPRVMDRDGNADPSLENEAGNRGTISWMDYTDMDSTSSLRFRIRASEAGASEAGASEAGPSGTHALKDIIIRPEILDRPVILREPQSGSRSSAQLLESSPDQAAPTLRPQGQGRSLDEQETDDQIRKRKGKSIMD